MSACSIFVQSQSASCVGVWSVTGWNKASPSLSIYFLSHSPIPSGIHGNMARYTCCSWILIASSSGQKRLSGSPALYPASALIVAQLQHHVATCPDHFRLCCGLLTVDIFYSCPAHVLSLTLTHTHKHTPAL